MPSLIAFVLGACGDDAAPTGPRDAGDAHVAPMDLGHDDDDAGATDDAAMPIDLGPPVLPACPTFADGESLGDVSLAELGEASGLVSSRVHASVLWIHNDSGDTARVFAISSEDASHLGTIDLDLPFPSDVEDIAIVPTDDGGWSICLGDIGDNAAARDSIAILRFREPDELPSERPFSLTLPAEHIEVTYPDGAHNAETLLADPISGDLFIVEKTEAEESRVYRLAASALVGGDSIVAEHVATISIGVTTGGDVSPDGSEIIVREYGRTASLWRRLTGSPLADAFATEVCTVPVHAEIQGESLGYAADGASYLTISEGEAQAIYRHRRE